MANVISTQILMDGPRNAQVKIVGLLDTSNLANQVIIDPKTLSSIMPGMAGNFPPTTVAIKNIDYTIEDTLDCRLYWAGASPALVEDLAGRGSLDYTKWGFLQNNAGSPTGALTLTTNGWVPGANVSFTLTFWLIKQNSSYNPQVVFSGSLDFSEPVNSGYLLHF